MINTEIKVSVIIPVYNAFDYLRPAMDSVIDQTLREIEIICIDDGSTDRSLDIIKEYQKSDERIRIITENNAGPATARNKGLLRSRGEYVIFLDADDFYELTLLERLYNSARSDDLDIAVCDFDVYNTKQASFVKSADGELSEAIPSGVVFSKSTFPDSILQSTTGYVWNKLFKRSFLIERSITFAPELYVFEDVYFVTTALCMADRIRRVGETLVHHRIYSEQSRSKLFKKYFHQIPEVYLKAKSALMQNGVYIPVSRSFLNLSAGRCYKLFNLLWSDAKAEFWNLLHSGYGESLGWLGHEGTDFDDPEVRAFVASIAIYTYDQYKKRVEKGNAPRFDSLGVVDLKKKIKKSKRRRRIALIFRGVILKPFMKKKNK